MPFPLGKTAKERAIARAKALGFCSLPCLVLAAVFFTPWPRRLCTGAQEFRHEVRSKCLADRPKYSLKQSVEDEQDGNRYHASGASKAKICDEKDHERRQQDVSSAPSIGKRTCWI